MSETSRSLSVSTGNAAGPVFHGGSELLDAVLPLLHGWLPGQRWFAGKGRPITGLRALSATELAAPTQESPGLVHLLLRVEQDRGTEGEGGDGTQPGDCYQLLLGFRPALPGFLQPALIGRIDGGRHDGTLVYDAPRDPQLAGELLGRLADAGHTDGLRFHRAPRAELPRHLPGRVGTAEQSNTSVVFGDALILKLFRRVTPGVNPDLELSLALSLAGCERVPAPAAWFDTRWPQGAQQGETTTLGLLQRFLPGSADGWELALASVPGPGAPTVDDDFTGESYLLGQATAEVHTVLARELPTTVLDGERIGRLAEGMAVRLDEAAAAVPELRPYRTSLRTAYHELARAGREGLELTAQRVHGDLHLGQVLRTTEGWVLLDFEGEPAKPVEERRRPQPAVRDVAAMLRSFDYAAQYRLVTPGETPGDRRLAEEWAERNRAAFRAGYSAVADQDPAAAHILMRAFETDKAVYEVLYEAGNRPAWLPVPMSAISRLSAQPR